MIRNDRVTRLAQRVIRELALRDHGLPESVMLVNLNVGNIFCYYLKPSIYPWSLFTKLANLVIIHKVGKPVHYL